MRSPEVVVVGGPAVLYAEADVALSEGNVHETFRMP
jgi:hypothetical protein